MRTTLTLLFLAGFAIGMAACSDDATAPNPGASDTGADTGADTQQDPGTDTEGDVADARDGSDTPDTPDAPDTADAPDAADVTEDADVPDVPTELLFGSALGGLVVDFPSTAALEDVAICLDDTPPADCVTSNEEGEFLIGGVAGGQRALARFTHARRLTNLLPWQPNTLDRPALNIPMLRAELLEAIYLDAELQLNPERGTLGFLIVADSDGFRPSLAGATVEVEGADTIYFRGSVADTEVDTTDATGLAVVPNMAPGTHEFTVTAPDRTCMEGLRWETDGALEAPAEVGALTIIYIICTRHHAVPDACSLTSQCRPSPAACVSTPTATACRADVDGCDDDTVCVGEVLVTDCRYGQSNGLDCEAAGGSCDEDEARCDIPRAQRCGANNPCEEGYTCLPSAGSVCAPSLTCMDMFGCLVGCEGDDRCAEHCIGRVNAEETVAANDMLGCMRRSGCGGNFVTCQTECADQWAACQGE